jgi:putative oxidoreductase
MDQRQQPVKSTATDRLLVLARWMLGLAFVWAALSKLGDLPMFLIAAERYELPLPAVVVRTLAAALPWVELACGLLLLVGIGVRLALVAVVVLLLSFLGLIGQAWLRGLSISCGCFDLSFLSVPDPYTNLVKLFDSVEFAFWRDLVLLALAGYLLARHGRRSPASPAPE